MLYQDYMKRSSMLYQDYMKRSSMLYLACKNLGVRP